MQKGIHLTKIWFDNDVIEFKVEVSDGTSLFSNRVYVGYQELAEVVSDLEIFRRQVYGGLLNIRFGEFGPEYANGAFHARLYFPKPGRLYITCRSQSEFFDFSIKNVAGEATLYLTTEPVLLDNFIAELKCLNTKNRDDANLEAI